MTLAAEGGIGHQREWEESEDEKGRERGREGGSGEGARAERNQCIDWAFELAGAIEALDERTNIIPLHVQRVHQSCAFRRDHLALLCKHFVCEAYVRVCIKTLNKDKETDRQRQIRAS